MTDPSTPVAPCIYCGDMHGPRCPWVKAIDYDDCGRVRRVEFFDSTGLYLVPRIAHT